MYFKALKREKYSKSREFLRKCTRVYDKRLLWRANLYLDECVNHTTGATIAGATDWNNRNPWYQDNSNLQNYNPWGISQTGGADVDGGQIDIQEWTRFDDSTGPGASLTALDNGEVYGSVAYSWAGADTPFHFNQDMLDQKDCINVFYRNVSGIWTNYYPNLPPVGAGNGETWPHTTSPTGNWDGYIFGSPTNNENHVWNPITISTPTRYPYTPNFTTYRDFIVGDHVDDETDIYTSYAAGLDCLGFIQRAANYPGNRYTTYELGYNRLSWLTTAWTWQGKATPEVWDINITTDEMHLIVPGDILYTPGHASIVLNIQYDGNEREVIPDNVTLIEAAYAGGSYMVVNHQTWGANYGGIAPGRSLGRLRTYE